MTDVPPHSGNRWEPVPAPQQPAQQPAPQPVQQPAHETAGHPTQHLGTEPPERLEHPGLGRPIEPVPSWLRTRRARAVLAAAAGVGIVAASGTTGFAVGHSLGDDHPVAPTSAVDGRSDGVRPGDGRGPAPDRFDRDGSDGAAGGTGADGAGR